MAEFKIQNSGQKVEAITQEQGHSIHAGHGYNGGIMFSWSTELLSSSSLPPGARLGYVEARWIPTKVRIF